MCENEMLPGILFCVGYGHPEYLDRFRHFFRAGFRLLIETEIDTTFFSFFLSVQLVADCTERRMVIPSRRCPNRRYG